MNSKTAILSSKTFLPDHFWRTYASFVVDSTRAAIVAIDINGQITLFNRQAELVFQKKRQDVIGASLASTFPQLDEHEHYLYLALKCERGMTEVENNYCPYTGTEGVFIHSVAIVQNPSGEISGAIWMRKDQTSRRRFQNEINSAEVQALVSQIAAGTAHEIRNPLTTTKGYIQLARQKTEQDVSAYLETALEGIEQIEEIITDLLSLFHPNIEGLQLTSINSLLVELLQLVQHAGTLVNIVIRTILDKQAPLCLVDAKLIKYVLLNILRNAMEAMPDGGCLTVKTAYHRETNTVTISVSDTGKGIKREDLRKIFDPFYTTKKEGSGLGLTLSNRIMHHHNGYIDVDSTCGEGSCVHLHLPVTH
ncbi:MAG TPA: ATP-binding protein [Oscillospiraceae bacterium]|nr:ATP-binding protein [Oscillospiraceae bacterium]